MKKLLMAACFLLIFTIFISCSSADEDKKEEEKTETYLNIIKDNISDYKIVRGDKCYDWETEAAVKFRKVTEKLTGFSLPITTDWEKESGVGRSEFEILIGSTNRESDDVKIDRSSIGDIGYIVKTDKQRLVIAANSKQGMEAALDWFFSEFMQCEDINNINNEKPEINIMSVPENLNKTVYAQTELFDISGKTDLVSICYSTWFDPVIDANIDANGNINPPNISEILAGKSDWGGINAFHYWGKPAIGYYRSTDREVIRTHMTQLAEAGIDFIIIDSTNSSLSWKATSYWDDMVDRPLEALLDTMAAMIEEGLTVPRAAVWCSSANGWDVVNAVYDKFYSNTKYQKCWVYWDGLPFFLTTTEVKEPNDKITSRFMWGLRDTKSVSEWSFLQIKNTPCKDSSGKYEQICVCVAMQETYMTEPTAHGREGGKTFWQQWKNAFDARPKVVTVTWWNEWVAQRGENNRFVDNYNPEYSRDIEPMEGGHGDTYYQWLKQYISAYKNHKECPKLVED